MEKLLLGLFFSGDELDMFQQTANTLPALYEQREWAAQASVQVLERPDMMAGYQNIFIAITLIVAMFIVGVVIWLVLDRTMSDPAEALGLPIIEGFL